MPIPSIPYSDNGRHPLHNEPLFSRFMAAMASLFKPSVESNTTTSPTTPETSTSNTTPKTTAQMKHYTRIEAALKVSEGFTPNAEGHVTLTEAQLQAIEDALQAHESNAASMQNQVTDLQGQVTNLTTKNTELTEQVNALKGTPAAQSPAVVSAHVEGSLQPTPADDYLSHVSSAKELYDLVGG